MNRLCYLFVFVFLTATQCISARDTILIGIAGGSGSGKSTLATKLQETLGDDVIVISQDSYYKDLAHLSPAERATTNFDHPDSIDFPLIAHHLELLRQGKSIEVPSYNFHFHKREDKTTTVNPAPIIIVEGILLLAVPDLRDLFDLKIYIETDDDLRVLRRIERDIKERGRDFAGVKLQYLETVKPMHILFVEPSKKYADVIIPGDLDTATGVNLVAGFCQRWLSVLH